MEFKIKLVTPSAQLSTSTFLSVISDLRKTIEKSSIHSIKVMFPDLKEKEIKRVFKGKVNFYFDEIKRGSWEIALIGAIGGLIGKTLYDLGIEIIKDSTKFKELKDKINGAPSKKIADDVKIALESKSTLGPYLTEQVVVTEEFKKDGTRIIKYESLLALREVKEALVDNDSQIMALLEEIEKKKKS